MSETIYSVDALPSRIILGRQTENGVRQIRIDCQPWLAQWPGLAVSIWVTPPGGAEAYPANAVMDGEVLEWTVSNADTAVAGDGMIEIMGTADGLKKLSALACTHVSVTTTLSTTEPPEAYQGWVDQVLAAGGDAVQAAKEAEKSAQYAAGSVSTVVNAASAAQKSATEASEKAALAETARADAEKSLESVKYYEQSAVRASLDAQMYSREAEKAQTTAAQSAQEAEASATLAGEEKQAAVAAADRAEGQALNAVSASKSAAQSATTADTKAQVSSRAAAQAEAAAEYADEQKQAAETAASEAKQAEANAKSSAQEAADSAALAATERQSAETAANNAQTAEESAEAAAIRAEVVKASIPEEYTALSDAVRLKAPAIICEQSGAAVWIADADATNALSVVSHIDAADGVTEVSLTRTGRNIFGGLTLARTFAAQMDGAVVDEDAKTIKYNVNDVYGTSFPINLAKPNTQYTLFLTADASNTATTINMKIRYADGSSDGTVLRITAGETKVYVTKSSETLAALYGLRSSGNTILRYDLCGIIEGVLTADDFVPYEGETLTVTLPETVTSGEYDWTTGVLTINEGGASRTVQLAPQQLTMLKGHNNLWSSTGNTDVRYLADTKTYIDEKIAAIAASIINA